MMSFRNIFKIHSEYYSLTHKLMLNIKRSSPKLTRDFCAISKKNTIGNIVKHWNQQFEDKNISDPIESIEYIVAHVLGTIKVII